MSWNHITDNHSPSSSQVNLQAELPVVCETTSSSYQVKIKANNGLRYDTFWNQRQE